MKDKINNDEKIFLKKILLNLFTLVFIFISFVKIIYDNKYGELLGCHIIGKNATNLISEIALARNLETTYYEVLKTIHPHPTLSEAIHEATGDALNVETDIIGKYIERLITMEDYDEEFDPNIYSKLRSWGFGET